MPSWGSSKMRERCKKKHHPESPTKAGCPPVCQCPCSCTSVVTVLPPGLRLRAVRGISERTRRKEKSPSRQQEQSLLLSARPPPTLRAGGCPLLLPKIPGSLLGCGRSFVFLGCLLLGALAARVTRTGLLLARKNVTMKGCLERGPRRPSSPAEPGSTLSPAGTEQEQVAGRRSAGGALQRGAAVSAARAHGMGAAGPHPARPLPRQGPEQRLRLLGEKPSERFSLSPPQRDGAVALILRCLAPSASHPQLSAGAVPGGLTRSLTRTPPGKEPPGAPQPTSVPPALHGSWDHNCRAEPCCHPPLTNGACCSWGFGPKRCS